MMQKPELFSGSQSVGLHFGHLADPPDRMQNHPDQPTLNLWLTYHEGYYVHDITKRILQILSG